MRPPVRYLGTFLADPLDVPTEVINYAAEQLGIADTSYVKRYTERRTTRFEHAEEIRRAFGLRDSGRPQEPGQNAISARSHASATSPPVFAGARGEWQIWSAGSKSTIKHS